MTRRGPTACVSNRAMEPPLFLPPLDELNIIFRFPHRGGRARPELPVYPRYERRRIAPSCTPVTPDPGVIEVTGIRCRWESLCSITARFMRGAELALAAEKWMRRAADRHLRRQPHHPRGAAGRRAPLRRPDVLGASPLCQNPRVVVSFGAITRADDQGRAWPKRARTALRAGDPFSSSRDAARP